MSTPTSTSDPEAGATCWLEYVPGDMSAFEGQAVKSACKDARGQDPLRRHKTVERRMSSKRRTNLFKEAQEVIQEVGLCKPDEVKISVDNQTSSEHTVITVECMDRKGTSPITSHLLSPNSYISIRIYFYCYFLLLFPIS